MDTEHRLDFVFYMCLATLVLLLLHIFSTN